MIARGKIIRDICSDSVADKDCTFLITAVISSVGFNARLFVEIETDRFGSRIGCNDFVVVVNDENRLAVNLFVDRKRADCLGFAFFIDVVDGDRQGLARLLG